MAKAISTDLRERLISAVESGMTRHAAAKRARTRPIPLSSANELSLACTDLEAGRREG